jgi:hypothetical protein
MAALLPLAAMAQNPEIHVSGNSITILSGDNTPDYMDNTDFGMVKICGNTATRTFTIHNTGTDSLHLYNVYTSGPGVVYFSLMSVPAMVIEPGGSSSFQLMFDPAIAVTETISLNILSDDVDEALYSFTVVGTGFEPEINVSGDGIYITDGDVTPSLTDLTDFGNVSVCGTSVISHTFTIENNSPGNGLNGIAVTITGANASDFTLTSAPATGISWAQFSTTFTIAFDPSAAGVRNATINISSDDCDENPFEFAITGYGDNPEAELRGNGYEIVNGDNTPSSTDHTNFGSVLVCIGTIYRDFTILNTGNAPLTVGTPVLSGPHIVDYMLTVAPATTVAPGGSTFFRILFNPSVTGLRSAAVSFSTNDCDENPYTFAIHGTGNVDVVPPTAICQNISLHLNSSGTASILPVMINNGSYDQCGTVILQSATPSAFTCSNVGPNNVTLTVADPTGNTSTCTSVVTVIDTVKPVAICRNISLQLNSSGTALITAPMLNNGSTDACGIASMTVNTTSVSCANIGANNVTLTVTDVNGNSKSCNSIVTVLDTVKPVAQCQNLSRYLNSSGTALITAPMLNNGSTDACGIASMTVNTTSVSCANIGANNVTLTVTDVNGNSKTCNSIVTVLDTVRPVVVCQNINVTLSGGVATVAASAVNNGSSDACGIAAMTVVPSTFNCGNLGVNTVTLTVTDASGNSASCNATVTVLSDLGASVTAVTNVNCNGGTTGSATVVTSGGAGPFTYNWLPAGGSNATANTLPAGTYTCQVTDNGGCSTSQTVSITEPTLLSIGINATPVLCNGDQSTVTVTATGGTPTYSGTGTFTAAAGPHTYTVTDANGCTATGSVTITAPDSLIAGLTATAVLCNGDTSTITVTAIGGTPAYSGTGTFAVTAGNYTFTVTDANGCLVTNSITVTQPAALSASANATPVSCDGGSNGAIDLAPVGGTVPYTFSWNNGAYLTEDLSGLTAGTYSWTVTDTNNCVISGTEMITSPPALTASVTAAAPTSCGGSDGSIALAVNGGTGTYSYLWNTNDTTATISGLAAGTYNCVVTDGNGCNVPAGITLNDPPAPVVTFALAYDTLCQATTAPFALTGGLPQGGTYSGPGVIANQFDPALVQTGFSVITYTYTDTTGCSATAMDSVWVDLCLGIADASDPLLIQVAPNPNNGSFVVRVHGSGTVTVQLYNAIGQLVASQQLQPDQPHLFEAGETGVYLLAVTDALGRRTVRRVLVSR